MAAVDGSALLASVDLWGPNFAPRNWAFCHGQIMPIAQNTALFSLLGTNFGGDGRTTFGLPDMRGRVPVGHGTLPGGRSYNLGFRGGSEEHTLNLAEMPHHTHTAVYTPEAATGKAKIKVNDGQGLVPSGNLPEGKHLGPSGSSLNLYYDSPTSGKFLAGAQIFLTGGSASIVVGNTGGTNSFTLVQPYTVVNFIICTEGIYPSRN